MQVQNTIGATGRTRIGFDPQTRRVITLDITNCPYCGRGHASMEVLEIDDCTIVVGCPSQGGAQITVDYKFTILKP